MPKKYLVEMTITNTETNAEVDSAVIEEDYQTDAEATAKFNKKVKAAEAAGRPDNP